MSAHHYFHAFTFLAATAAAAADLTLTTTFTNANQATAANVKLTDTWSEDANLPEVSGSISSLTNSCGDIGLMVTEGSAATAPDVLTPDSNVKDNPWALMVTYSSGSAAIDPKIASVTLSIVLFSSNGQYQSGSASWSAPNDNNTPGCINFMANLKNGENTLGTFTGKLLLKKGQDNTPFKVTLTPTAPVSLNGKTDFTISIALSSSLNNGTFVGLSSITYTLVPEP